LEEGEQVKIRVIEEVLDKQLLDVTGDNAGRVDGIVLELRDDKPPRLAYLEVSPITLLSRFSMPLAHWYARHDRRFGEGRGVPFRIPWSRVSRHGATLQLDFLAESTPINALEDWLRVKIVEKLPLARGKSSKGGGK
jgi:sporulation protein YlmC with PRC-barrel domain